MRHEARLFDANANRAREGLRVLEDAARFLLDDAEMCASLKSIRHDLQGTVESLPIDRGALLAHRAVPDDRGTTVSTPGEMRRETMARVVAAAAGRTSEALRVLEEVAKTLPNSDAAARAFESLRYRVYDAERSLALSLGTGRARQWRLCVLITEALCVHHSWDRVAELALEGGADCLQLREKSLDGGELVRRARRLIEMARPHGASVIVNDRADVAIAAGADGVHLGQTDMTVEDTRRVAGFRLLVGVSTADIEQARCAVRAGGDYCGVGPMFATTTKPISTAVGVAYLREYLADDRCRRVPHLAIGGITPLNVSDLSREGARGVAVAAAVCGSDSPASACRSIREALRLGLNGDGG
ncbi:MAG: thiamine phosphate synthase [Phycisphaerales bacterium]|nr:thiamine phosphate synthase [Phycisphaerales bacterium]